jgi:hypothetical protein
VQESVHHDGLAIEHPLIVGIDVHRLVVVSGRHQHDPLCLEKAATGSVGYELRMMGAVARPLTDGRPGSTLVGNALLEAYLTHVRCLHEFLAFHPPKAHPHTVRAVDY